MKPKATKSSRSKRATSKILKPSVSAATIKKTLKNIVEKDLLPGSSVSVRGARAARRATDVPGKSVKDAPVVSNQRGKKMKLPIVNDLEHAGSSQKPGRIDKSKRQKASLLDVPKLPTDGGTIFAFGENDVVQLGIPNVDTKTRPGEVKLPELMVDIAAGGMHSVCLSVCGKVYTFGCNDEGALGRPTTNDDDEEAESLPAEVPLPETMVMISAGDSHTAAVSAKGNVYIWGNFRNSRGYMGLTPDGRKHEKPIRILENFEIVKIASGADHLVCLSSDGDVYTCGCAEQGQLGRISQRSAEDGGRTGGLVALLDPGIVHAAGSRQRKFDNIWAGTYTTFLREKGTGHVYAFGLNNYSQLGYAMPSEGTVRYVPKYVRSFHDSVQIINGGQHHTLSLDNLDRVYATGRKEYGRLGLGDNAQDAIEPTLIPALQNQSCCDISCGESVSFAVDRDGNVYSWGLGYSFQLGHGNKEDHFVPTIITGSLSSFHVIKVAGGGQHTLVLARRTAK